MAGRSADPPRTLIGMHCCPGSPNSAKNRAGRGGDCLPNAGPDLPVEKRDSRTRDPGNATASPCRRYAVLNLSRGLVLVGWSVISERRPAKMSVLRIVALVALGFVATLGILLGWIALVYFSGMYTAITLTAEEALNLILVVFVAAVGLPLLHAAAYRWFWHIRRNRRQGVSCQGWRCLRLDRNPLNPLHESDEARVRWASMRCSTSSGSVRLSPPMRH